MRLDRPLDDLLRSGSSAAVLRALFQMPAALPASAREIARRAGVSHPTASRELAAFTEQGLVRRERLLRADAYTLDRDHILYPPLQELFGAERRVRDELVAMLREALGRDRAVRAAYLFGSAARGDMTARSDVDVAIRSTLSRERVLERVEPLADAVLRRFGNQLNVIVGGGDRSRSGVWRRIEREGIPLVGAGVGGRRNA